MADINFYGHWFPELPKNKKQPQQTQPPRPPVTVEPPSFERDAARWFPTERPSAARWTPPVDEHDVDLSTMSPIRQVNAPEQLPGFNPATMSAMRQINDMGAPSIETTTEAPPVPGVRNAAAIPPLAAPWINAAQNIWGALPELGEALKQAAPTALRRADAALNEAYERPATYGLIDQLFTGSKEAQAKVPTDPRTFAEEWQVAKSKGLGGGLLYGAAREQDVTTAPLLGYIWQDSNPTGYGEKVAQYKERRAELQRKIMEATSQIGGGRASIGVPEIAAMRQELANLDRDMRTGFFNRSMEGIRQQGAPLGQGRAAYNAWNQERAARLWEGFKNLTHEQKVSARETYREQSPMAFQFLVDWVFDPLMALDVLDEVNTIRRINKAMDLTGPAMTGGRGVQRVLTLEEIGEETSKAQKRAVSLLGRITPWQPTPESLAHAHVIQSADTVTRISEAARDAATNNPDLIARLAADPDDNPMTAILRRFLADPDDADIVELTGGFSQSRQAKRTVILMREMFGTVDEGTVAKMTAARAKAMSKLDDLDGILKTRLATLDDLKAKGVTGSKLAKAETAANKAQQALVEAKEMVDKLPAAPKSGDVDFDKLQKIIEESKGDDIAAVSALAQQYESAAKRLYAEPVTKEVNGMKVTEYKYPSQRSALRKWRGNISNAVSIMFLGTNPGYAFRNAANNLFTAVVDGVSPIMRADSLRELWTRWGPAPWQTKQGLGQAGDFWKSREAAREYVTSISKPMQLRDVFRAIEMGTIKDRLSTTLQVGQNFERYASERIMAHHVRNYWQQVWPVTVRRLTKELEAQGFTKAQVQYLQRRLDPCMNPQEVRDEIEKIIGGPGAGAPPAARPQAPAPQAPAPQAPSPAPVTPAPVPAPTKPQPKAAEGTVAPSPAAVTPPDSRLTVPEDVREEAMKAGGPEAVEAVDEVVSAARTPEEAVARLTVREAEMNGNAELSAAVEELRADTLDIMESETVTADDLNAYLDKSVAIVRKAQEVDDALMATTFEVQRGLDEFARNELWRETRAARRRNRLTVMQELDDLDMELMPDLGFDDEAIVRQHNYRAYVADTWEKSDKLVNDYWRAKQDAFFAAGASTSDIWADVNKQRRVLWNAMHERQKNRVLEFNEDVKRATGRIASGQVPPKGPPSPPAGPTSPAPTVSPFGESAPAPADETSALKGVGEGIAQGARNKADEYARRILDGEPEEEVLQGQGPAMRANVQQRMAELEPPPTAAPPDDADLLPQLRSLTGKEMDALWKRMSDYKTAGAGRPRPVESLTPKEKTATINAALELAGEEAGQFTTPDLRNLSREQYNKVWDYLGRTKKYNDGALAELRGKKRAVTQGNAVAEPKLEKPKGKPYEPPTVVDFRPATPGDYWDFRIRAPGITGRDTQSYGIKANRPYDLRFKVVDLDDLNVSHDDAFRINERFPKELQPRDRTAQASKSQVDEIVATFNPDWLLVDHRFVEDGPMVVTKENVVLAGNGRSLALRYIRDHEPQKLAAYRNMLQDRAAQFGIDPASFVTMKNPVLVRELDDEGIDLVQFARESNEKRQLAASAAEDAINDVDRITDQRIAYLAIGDNQSVDGALLSPSNKGVVNEFIESFPVAQRGSLIDKEGNLSAAGRERLKNALLAKTFQSDIGKRLAAIFIDSADPGIKTIEAGVYGALGKLSKVESAIRSGAKASEYSIEADIASAVEMLARLRQQGFTVREYLHPDQIGTLVTMHESELTELQEQLLEHLDYISRRQKMVREFLQEYADTVMGDTPNMQQMNMFGEVELPTDREGIVNGIILKQQQQIADEAAKRAGVEPTPITVTASDRPVEAGFGKPDLAEAVPAAAEPEAEVTAPAPDWLTKPAPEAPRVELPTLTAAPEPEAAPTPRRPYESPAVTWENEPGKMPPSYAPYAPEAPRVAPEPGQVSAQNVPPAAAAPEPPPDPSVLVTGGRGAQLPDKPKAVSLRAGDRFGDGPFPWTFQGVFNGKPKAYSSANGTRIWDDVASFEQEMGRKIDPAEHTESVATTPIRGKKGMPPEQQQAIEYEKSLGPEGRKAWKQWQKNMGNIGPGDRDWEEAQSWFNTLYNGGKTHRAPAFKSGGLPLDADERRAIDAGKMDGPVGASRKPVPEPKAKPKAEAPPAPEAKPTYKEIGTNKDGLTIYEDDRGVRSIVRNGMRLTEPVQMIPTRAGIELEVNHHSWMNRDWLLPDELADMHDVPKGWVEPEARQEPAPKAAPQVAPEAATEPEAFKVGDRIVNSDGEHGVIEEVNKITMQAWGGLGEKETKYSYTIRTDKGHLKYGGKGIAREVGEAPVVIPDPMYMGIAYTPTELWDSIQNELQSARNRDLMASRAKKPEKIREHKSSARYHRQSAEAKRKIFDEYAEQYPEEVAGVEGYIKSKTPAAAPAASTTPAAAPVTGTTYKTGTGPRGDGIELHFKGKPDDETLSRVKGAGFRWSKFQKMWYATENSKTLKLARELAGEVDEVATMPPATTLQAPKVEPQPQAAPQRMPEPGPEPETAAPRPYRATAGEQIVYTAYGKPPKFGEVLTVNDDIITVRFPDRDVPVILYHGEYQAAPKPDLSQAAPPPRTAQPKFEQGNVVTFQGTEATVVNHDTATGYVVVELRSGNRIKVHASDLGLVSEVEPDRLGILRELALKGEQPTFRGWWESELLYKDNPYYVDGKTLGQPFDYDRIKRDLQKKGYANLQEWWDAEIEPHKPERIASDLPRVEDMDERVDLLYSGLNKLHIEGAFPKDREELYKQAAQLVPGWSAYNEADIDELYDVLEAVTVDRLTKAARDVRGNVRKHIALSADWENNLIRRSRGVAITELQQFSTPYPLGVAMDYAANLRKTDIALEPNGGTGGLVAELRGRVKKVVVNELSKRRAAVLRKMGFDEVLEGDSLMLAVNGVRADVAILNPPWGKYSTGKYGTAIAGEFIPVDVAERHFAQVIKTLPDGGRMVALMPTTMLESNGFLDWLNQKHTVRAIIQSPPKAYLQRGTNVESVILVVDRGKWPGGNAIRAIGREQPQNWDELATLIERIEPRPQAVQPISEVKNVQPTGNAQGSRPGRPTSTRGGVGGTTGAVGDRGDRPGDAATGVVPARTPVDGRDADPNPTPGVAGKTGNGQAGSAGAPGAIPAKQPKPAASGGSVPAAAKRTIAAESDAELAARIQRELAEQTEAASHSEHFTIYQGRSGQRVSPHPRLVVETQTLAGAPYPELSYQPHPVIDDILRRGDISDEQYDVVRSIGQANEAGHAILVADDVGVGKSREIAGAVVDLFAKGKANRILLSTMNDNNVTGLMNEIRLVAGDMADEYTFVRITDYKGAKKGEPLPLFDKGVYVIDKYNFNSYLDSLKQVGFDTWFADEAHEYKNVDGANVGKAWRDMHAHMMSKGARLGYFTATPATDPDDLKYLYGLREWAMDDAGWDDFINRIQGRDADDAKHAATDIDAAAAAYASSDSTEIARLNANRRQRRGNKDTFRTSMTMAEMEQLMRELKRKGKYISRDLWRGGVEFNIKENPLTQAQADEMDKVIGLMRDVELAWRKYKGANKQSGNTFGPRARLQAEYKRRMFDFRLDTVLDEAEQALERGEQVVIYTESVNPQEVGRGGLASALNTVNTWAIDELPNGTFSQPQAIPEALEEITILREKIEELPELRDPIATIEERFGKQNVGFVIGKVSASKRELMMNDFQQGRRNVMVISQAGTTGINLHDIGSGRRRLIMADYQWRADMFKQTLGRVDRSGQRSSPVVDMLHTGSAGERKFIAAIANRMQALGALAKGQAGSAGASELDVFEIFGGIGRAAMEQTWFNLPDDLKSEFLGSAFMEQLPHGGGLVPRPQPLENAVVNNLLMELQLMPLAQAKRVEDIFVEAYDEIAAGAAEARAARTARLRGEVLRSTELLPDLTLHEVRNQANEKMGILEGVIKLTPTGEASRIKRVVQSMTGDALETLRLRYMNMRDVASGRYVSGLVVPVGRIQDVAKAFGKNAQRQHSLATLMEDLRAGDRVMLTGSGGAEYMLRMRQDGMIAIDGAKMSHKVPLMEAGAEFSPRGSFWFVPEEKVNAFVGRFPISTYETKGGDVLDFTGGGAGVGITAPGTPEAQELLNRIFGRSAMSTGAGRIASAGAMQPVWSKMRNHLTGAPDPLPPIAPDQARILRELANKKIIPNMIRDKATVTNLATQMRNFALGDYSDKRMINEWLAYIMPWSYWYTFTYPNWAQRLATNPSWVSNYARYKAALAKTNREYYRAVMDDQDAEMPEYWEDQIRVPFANTQLYFDLERTLMPLQALLNDFESRTRDEAPGGKVISDISEWGPSLHPLITWAYAAWLSSQGYREASDEWVGYLFPWSRALKGATALAREHIPALQGIIPAGGFTPEQLALQNVKGGDTWERRRIGYSLYTLWKEGRISEEEFQDAAYKQSGEAWDMARQAEAVKRAPGNLGSYLLGAGFKARDMSDIEIDRMNKEWGAIWDARYDKGVDESVWRGMLDEFEKKYPFKKAVSMAREPDQSKRLKDYAYSIIDRLPPGSEYYRMLEEAGMSEELLDRFKADKGDTSTWKPYEVKAFQAAIEKLADTVGVPSETQKAEYDQYWNERDSIRAAVEKATGHTYAEYQAANDEYNAEGADKKAVLAKYPWLKAGWDASKTARADSPTYQKFNPATGKATTATQSELSKKYDAAEEKFGPQVAGWADEYSDLPKEGTARKEWRAANPEKWAQVSAYYDFIYGDTRTGTGTTKAGSDYAPMYKPRTYSYGGRSYGGGRSNDVPMTGPSTPTEAPAYEAWTSADLSRMVQEERTDDPAFDTFVGLMFGTDTMSLADKYYSMSAEERAAWIAANPEKWARLLKFLLWLMKQTGVKTDYSKLLDSIPQNAPNVAPPVPSIGAPPVPPSYPTPPPVPPR